MSASGNPRIMRELRMFEDLDELATDLVEYISQLSENSVKERGVFSIALTGGTLVNLLRKLCEVPYNKTVDWTKWHVFWADERAVSRSHADSNYKLTKDGFLSKVSVLNSHMHSINDKLTVDEAARDYEFVIRQLVKVRTIDVSEDNDCPKFDLILLEMGPDGHVASLFPGNPALEQKEEWVTYITNSPESPPERITFTLPVINSASNVAIVATGEDKADAVCLAVAEGGTDEDCDGSLLLPAGMVRPTEGKLVWFLDNLSSSGLNDQ